MASLQMDMFEMHQSFIEDREDSNIEKNTFLGTIFIFTFAEYLITFLAALPLEDTINPIVFYCLFPVSLGFQIYFEFQDEIKNQSTRSILNYILGGLSIVSNYFCNYFIWNMLCYGSFYYYHALLPGKVLQITQILLTLIVFILYAYLSKTNFSNLRIMSLPIIIPFLLLFFFNFFYWGALYIQTIVITWFLILMVMKTKEMKQVSNSYDEIFVHSCTLLGVPFQIPVYLLKFLMTSHYSEDYLYQTDNKLKVAYLRKVAVTMFTITFFLLIFITQASFCGNEYKQETFCNYLINMNTFRFKPLYWISFGISLIAYVGILIGHNYFQHWSINWILFLVQVVFYSFVIFGWALYEYIYIFIYDSYLDQYCDLFIYGMSFSSLCGISIGLLVYVFNMADNVYNKSHAIGWMIFCPTCIWIAQIFTFGYFFNPIYIAYSFALLLGFLIFAVWISWELEWQLQDKALDLKQYDYYIGAIQVFEPGFSIFSRLFTKFM